MSISGEQRRLAAIMFTDMVGYTALSQRNEGLALELLEEHRRILRSIFPRFNGTEIKTIGDAFLVEFQSALEAAQCALEIQRTLAKRDADATADRQIQVRIGIHVGDVVHREGDVYGDGVNIASRIQPVAGIGGICISVDVERQIHHALEARFEKLAPIELKNVQVPMELFRIVLPWERDTRLKPEREKPIRARRSITHKTGRKIVRITIALAVIAAGLFAFQFLRPKIASTTGTAATLAPLTSTLPGNQVDQKSVAVLAFANLSGEKSNESFADSVSEELLNVLGKVRGLKVTARTSAFHFKGKDTPVPEIARQLGVAYVVEGSVRRAGEKVRIAAQLIKAADGFQVWSDDFNRDLKDIFAVQEEIAGLIAKNLELKLGIKNRTAPNPEAYQLYLEAVRLWGLRNAASLERAEQLLQRAIALQPDFARAHAAMGFVLSVRSVELGKDPMAGDGRALNEQALKWAERALALDPDLAEGYVAKGNVLENLGRWTECKDAYRRGIELDPNFATAHQWYARNLSEEGYIDEAMLEMKRAVGLDPLAPRILDNYGGYLIWLGKYSEALDVLDQVLAIQPDSPQALSFKAIALVRAGRAEEGRTILESLARRPDQPDWTRVCLAAALVATGRRSEADALLQPPPTENFYHGLLLCALGRGDEAIPLLKPVVSIYRDMILWTFQDVMPRKSPEFHRKLAEWDMTEAWQRAEAWRAKNFTQVNPTWDPLLRQFAITTAGSK